MRYSTALFTMALLAPLALSAQEKGKAKGSEKKAARAERSASVFAPDQITWTDGPPSLPSGAKMAVLHGNPTKGGTFTMRLMLPDGFTVQPHFHPTDEHVTVLKGKFMVGMGDKFDESKMQKLETATFAVMPAGMRHYAKADGQTILQIHGKGPFKVTYVNKADDPRTKVANK